MHENMTFVIGTLNFVSRCFPPETQEALWTTKCRYNIRYTTYVEGFLGLGVGGQGPGGGGCTLIFSYIRSLSPVIFFLFKILNFNIFGGFQKNKYFLGYENFVDIFWGHHKIGLYLGDISMLFRVFS